LLPQDGRGLCPSRALLKDRGFGEEGSSGKQKGEE